MGLDAMSKKHAKSPKGKTRHCKSEVLEAVTPADALAILRQLAEQDDEMSERIEAVALEVLRSIDVDSLASEVQMELESLDLEDVWAASGRTADGYVDPGEAGCQILEDAMAPFQEQVEKYRRLSMDQEAKFCCMGILKGVYDFDKESSTEYKEWAVDIPAEFFAVVLEVWQKGSKKREDLAEMDDFLKRHCPDWA